MPSEQKIEIRDLRNGDWYWVPKAVIREYAPKVGAIGIVVYDFLASLAGRDQECFPSQKYIARTLGYSRSYINETLKLLEKSGLIRIEKKGRYHRIYHLLKLRCQPGRTQVSTIANSGVNQADTNDNKITRIKNIDISNFKKFKPKTREELLAFDLARSLKDLKGFPLYLSYAKRYPESLLRKILGEVREIPDHKIKKSRGALFNHLIQKYAKEIS
ncbi:MAG: helix-turn-helix domain-containing protein [Deltaproteobacteria bacterium]|nr:helix-turn-helix domain-containing protein [Deltaproteobacteria bacterium]